MNTKIKKAIAKILALTCVITILPIQNAKVYGEKATTQTIETKENKETSETIKSVKINPVTLKVKAKSAVALDIKTGEIVSSKNPTEKMSPSSLTKLMTALILAENRTADTPLRFTEGAKQAPAYSINKNLFILNPGDVITCEDTLEAILLLQANDACVLASENVSKTKEDFVALMNKKAQEIGMTGTKFDNPTGDESENNYTTAYDLALLLKEAYNNGMIQKIMQLKETEINTKWQKIGKITNRNKITGQNGNIGSMFGFSEKAGRNLMSLYNRDGRIMACVLLKDGSINTDTFINKDMEILSDDSYGQKKVEALKKDERLDSITLEYKLFKWFGPTKKVNVDIYSDKNLEIYPTAENVNNVKLEIQKDKTVDAFKLKKGLKIGTITLDNKGLKQSANLISDTDAISSIYMPNIIFYIAIILALLIFMALIIILFIKIHRSKAATQIQIRKKRHDRRRRNIYVNQEDEF